MRTLGSLAALVVILAGLHVAAPIIVPLLLATAFAIAFQPMSDLLRRRRVPTFVASVVTVLVVLCVLGGLGTLAAVAVSDLVSQAPRYADQISGQWEGLVAWLDRRGLGSLAEGIATANFGGRAAQIVQGIAVWLSGAASDLFTVLLLTVFLQLETVMLRRKLELITVHQGMSQARRVFESVQRYLRVKFVLACMNGLLLGTWCWLWGVSNPLLWGVAAFALNFIPILGSLLAAIPPILLGLVEGGFGTAIGVAAGYVAVNVAVDNMLEPRLMGRTLDLSPLVLLVSLLSWGLLLGPTGALLSFPLTVAMRLACEQHPDLRWIAVLLAAKPPAADDRAAESDGAEAHPAAT